MANPAKVGNHSLTPACEEGTGAVIKKNNYTGEDMSTAPASEKHFCLWTFIVDQSDVVNSAIFWAFPLSSLGSFSTQ